MFQTMVMLAGMLAVIIKVSDVILHRKVLRNQGSSEKLSIVVR